MHENENRKEHLNKFNEITNQLNYVEIKFDNVIQALSIHG